MRYAKITEAINGNTTMTSWITNEEERKREQEIIDDINADGDRRMRGIEIAYTAAETLPPQHMRKRRKNTGLTLGSYKYRPSKKK